MKKEKRDTGMKEMHKKSYGGLDLEKIGCEASVDGCAGWKNPSECPNDGKFDSNSPACQECEQDAMDAMTEIYKGE